MQRLCRRFVNPFQGYNLVHVYQRRLVLYSTSTATSASTDSFANYLVDSLGFSPQQALSASKKLCLRRKINDFYFHANAVSVVGYLKNCGLEDTLLRRLVFINPKLLTYTVEKTLRPKLQFLKDQGFSESDIIRVIHVNPNLLLVGLESVIVPSIQILRQVTGCNSHVIKVTKKIRWIGFTNISKYLLSNIALLSSYGISIEFVRKPFIRLPGFFLQKAENFKEIVNKVEKKLGTVRTPRVFLCQVYLLSHFSEDNIESKCQIFKNFGWTQSDIATFMVKNGNCFTSSAASTKKKLDFLMNELQLKPACLISKVAFFTCSLEKRIMPRHKVLLILKEKGLLEMYPALVTTICMSESNFLKKFVQPFKEVHEVYCKLTGCTMIE